jgi:hypothetical protein
VEYSAVVVAVFALLFAVASFWWLNARTGSITATEPRAYAFGRSGPQLRLRFPFAFFNNGARALIVEDMRIVIDSEPGRPELRWVTSRDRLRPEPDDGFAFATPFSIPGRTAREVIAEFEPTGALGWSASPDIRHRLQLRARVHPKREWVELVAFDFWPPPQDLRSRSQYLAHRNAPSAKP